MDLEIAGKVALVGASGRGLGLATARRLAAEGCDVALCDVDPAVLEPATAAVAAAGTGRVRAYEVDLLDAAEIERLVDCVRTDLGPVSILVANAGGPPPGGFDAADDDKWQTAFELTFMSTVRLVRACLPDMKAQQWGRIVTLTSRALKEPIANLILSNAMRLGVGGLTKTLVAEVARNGITVNNVCPGPTATDRALELAAAKAKARGTSVEQQLESTCRNIPIGRLARPDEVAAAAAFLASQPAGYITGVSLLVDGGAVRAL